MEYLLFRLYGPLASWGEIAVGESRHSAVYPSKSALLGLMAAALGIRREDEERQASLSSGYRFAVKVITTGHPLRDYHTTQVPDSVGKFAYRTRRDELIAGRERLGTILSSREYRCDALSLIAVAAQENAAYTLGEVLESLLRPKFHLYLGRKSCPLAAPLNPRIVNGESFGHALDNYSFGPLFISKQLIKMAVKEVVPGGELVDAPPLATFSQEDSYVFSYGNPQVRYYWEGKAEDLRCGNTPVIQTLTRHDQPLSRSRWQFAPRTEYLCLGREEN